MKEEKMIILSMLEEGKISIEEAAKLLEALEETEGHFQFDTTTTEEEFIYEKENIKNNIKDEIKRNAKKAEGFGANLGNLISNIVNNIVDKSTSFSSNELYETINANIERDISNIENPIIDFESINGGISVKSWNDDKISIDVTIKYKGKAFNENEIFYRFYKFNEENGTFRFEPTYKNNVMISLNVSLPNKYYKEITLKTTNGKIKINGFQLGNLMINTNNGSISVGNTSSNKVDLSTQNGKITLNDISAPIINSESTNGSITVKNINSENLDVSTINGRINFIDIQSDNVSGRTSNSSINLEGIMSKKVKLKTSNGAIICKDIDKEKIKELDLSTSNSSIDITLEKTNNIMYFDLETALGSIALEIPDLVYKVNKQANVGAKRIIAHSTDFDETKEYFLIKASTSNGSIKIR